MIAVKKVEEAPTEEEEHVEEQVEEVQEEIPVQVEPVTVAPQFTQIFDDVVSSSLVFIRLCPFVYIKTYYCHNNDTKVFMIHIRTLKHDRFV